MIAGIATSRAWMSANRDAAAAVVAAVGRAIDDLAAAAPASATGEHVPHFDRNLDAGDLQRVFDCAHRHGLADRSLDAAELILPLD
jgi:ABC-type nitrate/sulfonate/bicarbonate transport system substrate-binding protein